MRLSVRSSIAAFLAFGVASSVGAQAAPTSRDSSKVALIRELLSVTHAVDQSMIAMEAMVPAQKAANPRIPAVFWDRFLAQARARRGELEEAIVVVYERHFSTNEIVQLLAFYRTPIGQKVLSTLPAVLQESVVAGQEWGQRIGAAIGAQLESEGVHIKP